MKKRNLKSLKLNKKSISSLLQDGLAGGSSRTSNLCSVHGCTFLGCERPGDPAPSKGDTASWCICE